MATLLGVAILVGLGSWQMERRAWKAGLIADRAAALAAPPIALPPARADWAGLALRRATVTGHFDHDREFFLASRFLDGGDQPGLEIVTPLRMADGGWLLVNRGWIPSEARDAARRRAGQPAGDVTLTGRLRQPDRVGPFTPANDVAGNLWFATDPAAMAAAAGVAPVAPLLLDADGAANPGGLPIGGRQGVAEIPNNHLNYALTWYGLAAALAGVSIAYRISLRRPSRAPEAP